MAKHYSSIDLIDQCDAFPYENAPSYQSHLDRVYPVLWADHDDDDATTPYPIGYMLRTVFAALAAIPAADWSALGFADNVDLTAEAAASGTVPLYKLLAPFAKTDDEPGRTKALLALAQYWRERKTFQLLRGWRDEPWPVYGKKGELIFSMERAFMGLFGTNRYGVHMTAYVTTETEGETSEARKEKETSEARKEKETSEARKENEGRTKTSEARTKRTLKIWVPRRAADKSTYPSMLDNTVAGGLVTGEDPLECLVREADEEASLPADVVRANTTAHGTITYVYLTDPRAGGESGLVYPELEWIYECRLPADVVPQPKDGEVAEFMLCTVDEVRAQLARGEYKPNCAVVLLDFFVRHGLLTRDNEPDYDEVVRRLHRPLPFPGPPGC